MVITNNVSLPISSAQFSRTAPENLLPAANKLEEGALQVSALLTGKAEYTKIGSPHIINPAFFHSLPQVKGNSDHNPKDLEGFIKKYGSKKNLVDYNSIISLNQTLAGKNKFGALSFPIQSTVSNYSSQYNINSKPDFSELI